MDEQKEIESFKKWNKEHPDISKLDNEVLWLQSKGAVKAKHYDSGWHVESINVKLYPKYMNILAKYYK